MDDLTPSTESPVPSINIRFYNKSNDLTEKVLIFPQSLKFIHEAYKNIIQGSEDEANIGVIEIRDQETDNKTDEEDEDYSLEEQLYQAHASDLRATANVDIEIKQLQNVTFVIVPNFASLIFYNILSKALAQHFKQGAEILTVTPGQNPPLVNVSKLSTSLTSPFDQEIPALTPPYYVTGISASLLTQTPASSNVTALILQSEGPQGYEKVNDDAIGDVATPLAQFTGVDRKKLLSAMRKEVGGVVNNFALYL